MHGMRVSFRNNWKCQINWQYWKYRHVVLLFEQRIGGGSSNRWRILIIQDTWSSGDSRKLLNKLAMLKAWNRPK